MRTYARSANTEAKKIAKETRDNKLSKAYEDKKSKIDECEQSIRKINEEYEDAIQTSDDELQTHLK